jgi:hypothetical protein
MTDERLEDLRQNYSADLYSAFHLSLALKECIGEIDRLKIELAEARKALEAPPFQAANRASRRRQNEAFNAY